MRESKPEQHNAPNPGQQHAPNPGQQHAPNPGQQHAPNPGLNDHSRLPPNKRGYSASHPEVNEPTLLWTPGECSFSPDAGSTEERIRALAGVQNGRFARWQLLAAGIDRHAVDRRLANGSFIAVHPGVYTLAPIIDAPLAPEIAALLVFAPGDAWLSHHSAIVHWRIRVGVARPVRITIPLTRGRGPRPDGVCVFRSGTLRPDDVTTYGGLPVTTPARAILDIAAGLRPKDLKFIIGDAFARHACDERDLHAQLARCGRHPGRWNLHRALTEGVFIATDSEDELRLIELIARAGLPIPLTQVPMLDYTLDLYYPGLALAIEVDAYGTHGSRRRFEDDRVRDTRLRTEAGITVARITRTRIRSEPLAAVATVAQEIATAAAARRAAA